MNIFKWIKEQIFGMKWLSEFVEVIVEDWFKLSTDEWLGGSIHFFIYDLIKIIILLIVMIFIVTYIQSYFPPERTQRILGRFKGFKGIILGALLGILTPFCSCSSIPIFIGFTAAGLPLGVTFAFLIASPLIDLASFVVILSYFGLEVGLIYVAVGFILAIIGGSVIGKLKMESQIEDFVLNVDFNPHQAENKISIKDRAKYSINQSYGILRKVWLYIVIGVGIGAMIYHVIPIDFIEKVIGNDNHFAVIISTIMGVPMYANILVTISIAGALFAKGVGIGTIVSFMMAVTALSLPSMIMLSKVVKKKLLFIFIIIVSLGIIVIGYLLNWISYIFM